MGLLILVAMKNEDFPLPPASGPRFFKRAVNDARYNTEKAPETHCLRGFVLSTPSGARTLDTLIKSQVLYQLS